MDLIKCPECGHEVDDNVLACPKCGYPIREHKDEQSTTVCPE